MSSSVDSRIVSMKFENTQFERAATQTMGTMDKLKKTLDPAGLSKGLSTVQKTLNGTNLSVLEGGVTRISKKFLALGTVAVTALTRITNSAIDAGTRLIKSLTIAPIQKGLKEYETTLNSVQTILANTGLKGQKGLDKVNGALKNLNDYSDKTIYNFSEMARNIGTFTAAGIKLKPATSAIKGIANLAAVSGSSAEQASTAMYQLSQALASGSVKLMDWNSVVNAGMGGKVFQESLKATARAHGVAVDSIIKKSGSFRESLKEGWLDKTILTDTLKQFAGEYSKADLIAQGFSQKQAQRILEMGKTATDAATKVKTMSQLINTLQETAGSGWAQTWQLIFGNFGEAKSLFTGLNDTLGGIIKANADARNKLLGDWKKLGGRTDLIEGIKNIWEALLSVIRPIKEAFRDIFPAMTGKRLAELTENFREFTEKLTLSGPAADALKRIFTGVFAVFDIGWRILKGVIGSFFSMFGVVNNGTGGVLELVASIADVVTAFRDWLVEGDKIGQVFQYLRDARDQTLVPLVNLVSKLAEAFAELVSGGGAAFGEKLSSAFGNIGPIIGAVLDNIEELINKLTGGIGKIDLSGIFGDLGGGSGDAASKAIDGVSSSLEGAKDAAEGVDHAFDAVGNALVAVKDFVVRAAKGIKDAFVTVKDAITGGLGGVGMGDTLAVINTGFLTLLYLSIRKFVKQVGGTFQELKNAFKAGGGVLNQVTANLKSMQTEVRARAIFMIAAALALLAAAIYVLSKVDTAELAKGLGAVVILLGALTGAILALEAKTKGLGAGRVALLAGAMVLMAGAVLLLSGAVALLGQMDSATLAKGLGSVTAILGIIVAASAVLSKTGGAAQMVAAAAAIGILAVSLTLFAGALKLYASLDTMMMLEGGLKAALAIAAIGIAMRALPKDMLKSAASLAIVSASLLVIAGAMKIFATMSVEDMAKSLIMLGGSLMIISVALKAMEKSVKGAAALLLVSAALAVLVPTLVILGNLDVTTIATALGALAGIFLVLAVGAKLLGPAVPVLVALAGAVALLGLAVALIGGGMFLFAAGLATLAASGMAGVAVLTAAVIAFAQLLPLIALQFGLAIRALAAAIGGSGPELVAAFSAVLGALIQAVTNNIPKFARMLLTLITYGLAVIRAAFPQVLATGISMIMTLLKGIENNIGKVVTTVGKIIVKFIQALGKQVPKIIDAGAQMILDLIRGLADAIDKYDDQLIDAGWDLAEAIITGMLKGLAEGPKRIAGAAWNLGKSALGGIADAIKSKSPSKEAEKLGRYVGQGFAIGVVGSTEDVNKSLEFMKSQITAAFEDTESKLKEKQDELARLTKAKKGDTPEAKKLEKQIATLKTLHANAANARKVFNKDLKDEQGELRKLAAQYDKTTKKLEEANKKLDEAKKAKEDFAKSTTAKYSAGPAIGEDENTSFSSFADKAYEAEQAIEKFQKTLTTLKKRGLSDTAYNKLLEEGVGAQGFLDKIMEDGKKGIAELNSLGEQFSAQKHTALDQYLAGVEKEAADVEKFKASLDQLKALGLDDASYRKLVEEGPSAQPFVDQLLASGAGGVNQLNALNARLAAAATSLGEEAARVLYQGGIDSAQKTVDGLVDGLNNPTSIKALERAMARVARKMVKALKKELKIKSPSRVGMDIGKFFNLGVSGGLDKYTKVVEKSAETMANSAVDTIKKTMTGLSSMALTDVNMNPVIAPVIDLTQAEKDAAALNKMLAVNAEVSYAQAQGISSEQQTASQTPGTTESATQAPTTVVEYTQNNYSPKALSEVEIFRNTRNSLSLVREALNA